MSLLPVTKQHFELTSSDGTETLVGESKGKTSLLDRAVPIERNREGEVMATIIKALKLRFDEGSRTM
jgi:hypothetical protein